MLASAGPAGIALESIAKYDNRTGNTIVRRLDHGRVPCKAIFVPAEHGTNAGDGWLMSFVYDPGRDASDLLIRNACTLDEQATVELPGRVPFGFHGTWIPADPS